MRYIGIDLGTSFIKGAVLDLEGLCVGDAKRIPGPLPLSGLPSLRTEFSPESFVDPTRRIIEELLAEAPDCQGVLMSVVGTLCLRLYNTLQLVENPIELPYATTSPP